MCKYIIELGRTRKNLIEKCERHSNIDGGGNGRGQVFISDINGRKCPEGLNIIKVDRLQLKGKWSGIKNTSIFKITFY